MNWPDLCLSGRPSQDILREVGSLRILHICSQRPESWPQPSLTSVCGQAGRPTLWPHPPTGPGVPRTALDLGARLTAATPAPGAGVCDVSMMCSRPLRANPLHRPHITRVLFSRGKYGEFPFLSQSPFLISEMFFNNMFLKIIKPNNLILKRHYLRH
ncbi:unnamed protein product [Rangifer tarandus platyrhynchus]|uniref:Uncharacterized protein n=1 Tax=Rangifer tarandus platyrhynchus TaxID=3082113 RepID=A0AC59YZI9_RANTA